MSQLSNLNHELHLIEERIAELYELFSLKSNEIADELKSGASAASVATYKVYLNCITAGVRQKELEKAEQLKRIERKQAQIIAANIEIASMEKLKEKQLAEYTALEAKAREIELNEFITNLAN